MADFSSYLSDTDESAVEELISQAQDLVALEQLSSLNVSSVLPSHLESRFQNLKSFPPRIPLTSPSPLPGPRSKSELGCRTGYEPKLGELDDMDGEDGKSYGGLGPEPELGKMRKNEHRAGRDGFSSSDSSGPFGEDAIFTPQKAIPVAETGNPRARSKRGGLSGGPGFNRGSGWVSDSSQSPPRKGGCFWCSPKKKPPRKNKDLDLDSDVGFGKHEELLSDLGSFSVKEQRRVLKEAMKEQERLTREAEKIVRIAKQASARMQIYGDSSDDDNETKQ